jgi:hypothetical protein
VIYLIILADVVVWLVVGGLIYLKDASMWWLAVPCLVAVTSFKGKMSTHNSDMSEGKVVTKEVV